MNVNINTVNWSEIINAYYKDTPLSYLCKGNNLLWTNSEIYGWYIDPSVSDPSLSITYLENAIGKTPVTMGSTAFNYGDWGNAFFMPKPCMLKYDGTVDYYLEPDDYSLRKVDNLTPLLNFESGGFYTLSQSDVGQPIPSTDPDYTETYIRDITYYPVDTTQSTLYAYVKSPRLISNGLYLTLIYVYFYDENKQCLDQQYSGGRGVEPIQVHNAPGLPIPITQNSKYFRVCYGQKSYNGSTLPDISQPSDYNDQFILSYTPIMSDVSDTAYNGNAMMEWPKIWYKFESLTSRGYQQLEYITSNGDNDYVVTDIVGLNAATDYIECDMSFGALSQINDGTLYFGCATLTDTYWTLFGVSGDSTSSSATIRNNYFYFTPNYSTGGGGQIKRMRVVMTDATRSSRSRFNLKTPVSTIYNYSSNTTYTPTVENPSWDASSLNPIDYVQQGKFTIFAANYYIDTNTEKFYYCNRVTTFYGGKIYRNNQLIHNLIPVKRIQDNAIGIYDTLTNKFYNSYKGTLVAGNVLNDSNGWFYCANRQIDVNYNCWSNYDCNNNVIDHFYTSIYNGTGTTTLRSLSDVALTSANGATNVSTSDFITRASANNTTQSSEWYIDVLSDRILINALLVLIGKNSSITQVFGNGVGAESTLIPTNYTTGNLNNKGLFWGSTTDLNSPVKIFGMENWYGMIWRELAGLMTDTNSQVYYKLTSGTIDGSSASGYNLTASGYKQISCVDGIGWVTTKQFTELPMASAVTSNITSDGRTTYYGEFFFNKPTTSSNYGTMSMSTVGGSYDATSGNKSIASPGTINMDTSNLADNYIGASLSCKPLKT